MALPVIADVFRCALTLTGSALGSSTNVFHISAPGATATDVANGIDTAAASGDPWSNVASSFGAPQVVVTPLDGVSGSHAQILSNVTPGIGGSVLYESALVIKLGTGFSGREHRGRMFIGPLTEDHVSAGVIDSAVVSDEFTQITDFITALNGLAIPMDLGVASYKLSTWSSVTSIIVTGQQRTQRRRLRRVTGR